VGQQFWQLHHVRRNRPGFVFREQLGRRKRRLARPRGRDAVEQVLRSKHLPRLSERDRQPRTRGASDSVKVVASEAISLCWPSRSQKAKPSRPQPTLDRSVAGVGGPFPSGTFQSCMLRFYPKDPLPDEIKDRGQVRAMWRWARDLDRENLLWCDRPIELETGSKEDLAIQLTEGWILGCSPTVRTQ
jgi:hypothetical protein